MAVFTEVNKEINKVADAVGGLVNTLLDKCGEASKSLDNALDKCNDKVGSIDLKVDKLLGSGSTEDMSTVEGATTSGVDTNVKQALTSNLSPGYTVDAYQAPEKPVVDAEVREFKVNLSKENQEV